MKNFFTVIFSTIRWQDFVDIVLNSYILFRFYALFRGTTTFRVLVVIAFLWFAQRTASFLGLIVTSWAIQGITAAAALIIIIVFRFEIRSVLQAKNIKGILWGFPRKQVQTPAEVIVESVFDLAAKRFGGLLIFPAKEDLKDLIQRGIKWQGVLSKEMIVSIFWPDNPVHDGAAIVEDNRVSEVGVILPLSNRQDMPSYYGTRHRAAAGIAEATDALAIVVSEERGRVSVAKGSRFISVQTRHHLLRLLLEHFGMTREKIESKKRDRIQLAIAAAASFILVTGIWFSFSRGFETLLTYDIPIEYTNRDPRMEILDTSLNTVSLQVSGSGSLIKSLRPEQIALKVDLSKAVAGKNIFPISAGNITLPPGVVMKRISPQSVQVTLDVPVKKKLPVQVNWSGQISENLRIESVSINPQVVEVIGNSLDLPKTAAVYTERVPLESITESGVMTVGLALQSASLKPAPGAKDKVTVTYVVKPREP